MAKLQKKKKNQIRKAIWFSLDLGFPSIRTLSKPLPCSVDQARTSHQTLKATDQIIYSKIEEELTVHSATVNCLPLDFTLFTTMPTKLEWVGRHGATRFHAIYNNTSHMGLGWEGKAMPILAWVSGRETVRERESGCSDNRERNREGGVGMVNRAEIGALRPKNICVNFINFSEAPNIEGILDRWSENLVLWHLEWCVYGGSQFDIMTFNVLKSLLNQLIVVCFGILGFLQCFDIVTFNVLKSLCAVAFFSALHYMCLIHVVKIRAFKSRSNVRAFF
ncbi:hypothetical protein DVH24_015064 [Malus domestica]|uniref:Uncharacterized protein n=1 Tax=Malus domestica TaxID=3750 RepID=A0A498K734_MALDO|nr:hypothetical protein DVH24_015064 [Malus domestica]